MSNNPTLTYLPNEKKYSYNLLNQLQVDVHVTDNPYQIPMDYLFGLAARKNKKRGFLFVSKILGKHLPVDPALSIVGGALLSSRFMEVIFDQEHKQKSEMIDSLISGRVAEGMASHLFQNRMRLPQKTLFIGFAETATALGHAMFDCFTNACYAHSTREDIVELESTVHFEEEHSHATSQRCYIDSKYFEVEGPVVLVDDEITTGKTALNIIRSIHKKFPRKEYIVCSLLDWRSAADKKRYKQLEEELHISIKVISILSGEIVVVGQPIEKESSYSYECPNDFVQPEICYYTSLDLGDALPLVHWTSKDQQGLITQSPYLHLTGRFGMTCEDSKALDQAVRNLATTLSQRMVGKKVLCLGTGEFMYIPMKISAYMEGRVLYQSTTRSPIHRFKGKEYAINSGFSYPSPEDPMDQNFFYNIPYGEYDDIFLFIERGYIKGRLDALLSALEQVGAKTIHVVQFSNKNEGRGNE